MVDNSSVTVYPGAIHHIVIDPSTDFIVLAGNMVHFTAIAYDQDGNIVPAFTFLWNNATDGWFMQTIAGKYMVYAYISGVMSNQVEVTVYPNSLDHILITPSDNQTITTGETIHFNATGYDIYNNIVYGGLTFIWYNTDASGLFDNTIAGEYLVKACNGGICSNEVTVKVNAKPLSESESTTTETTSSNEQTTTTQTSETQSETEVVVDDQGKIKGSEVTTVGPELEEESGGTNWLTIIVIAIAFLVLIAAYYAYNYFLTAGPYDEKKKNDDKESSEDVDDNDTDDKNRW